MTLYVKIDRASGSEMERRDLGSNPSRAFNKSTVWLPLVVEAKPAFDPETRKLVPARTLPAGLADLSVPVDPAAQAIDGWTDVALTAAELLERRNAKLAVWDAKVRRPEEDLIVLLIVKLLAAKSDFSTQLIDAINAKRTLRGEPPL